MQQATGNMQQATETNVIDLADSDDDCKDSKDEDEPPHKKAYGAGLSLHEHPPRTCNVTFYWSRRRVHQKGLAAVFARLQK